MIRDRVFVAYSYGNLLFCGWFRSIVLVLRDLYGTIVFQEISRFRLPKHGNVLGKSVVP